MDNLLELLNHTTFIQLVLFGLIVNFAIYFCSLGLYLLLSWFSFSQPMGAKQPILRSDILLSLMTVLCNTLVFILGVILWKTGWIELNENTQWLHVLLELLTLTLIMDLLMYIFHRSVHFLRYFRRVHERHHEHESTNLLSLFVLHPIESIGFGLMMLGVILLVPFSAPGISLYLILNSLWGTIGHLNHSVLPASWLKIVKKGYLCTSEFHYQHHQNPNYNFGFYTSVWDVIFKTIHPSYRNKKQKS